DAAGNLIAEMDFSQANLSGATIGINHKINANPIRRDQYNKEYFDRNISLLASKDFSGPIKIKYYFLNTELTRLINEPDDGIADVNSINDLKMSKTFLDSTCYDFGKFQNVQLINPSATGTYDVQGSFIEFHISVFQTRYYLHGGTSPLKEESYWLVDICPGGDAYFNKFNFGEGYSYQWQVDSGDGFGNII